MFHRNRSALRDSLTIVAPIGLALFARAQSTDPYSFAVDRVEGAFVTLANFPVRPLAKVDTSVFWAVNHLDSTIERFSGTTTTPNLVVGMPWNPVGIALWDGPSSGSSDDEMIVTCRGTWCVVRVDADSGAIVGLVQLRPADSVCGLDELRHGLMAEPADIVIDNATDQAFVSCPGVDSVVQIDLESSSVVRIFHETNDPDFRCKQPTFLSLTSTGDVLVAPLLSGNNSTWLGAQTIGHEVEAPPAALPDQDLFRITPDADPCQADVTAVMTGLGTVLFAQGYNANTGDFWQVNTDALNKGDSNQSEPMLSGKFSKQGVTIVHPSAPTTYTSLDPSGAPGGNSSLSLGQGLGQPFALAFDGRGRGFITGLLTDNVAILSSAGAVLGVIDLPPHPSNSTDRRIPRGVVVRSMSSTTAGKILVHCWGDSTIREYSYSVSGGAATTSALTVFELSHDPTPAHLKPGRSTFFDGSNSLYQNVGCTTCHVEAGNDLLVWNLSHRPNDGDSSDPYFPIDDKAGMVTQLMVGLERIPPFHWRGERQLRDFNPAFAGLLGGEQLTIDDPEDPQFEDFQAYVFSLVNPANPNQNRERVLDDSIHFPGDDQSESDPLEPHFGSAIEGEDLFRNVEVFGGEQFRCINCHSLPTGTINDVNDEAQGTVRSRLAFRKPAPFHELWKKSQTPFCVQTMCDDIGDKRGFLGSGFSHVGVNPRLIDFISAITAITGTDPDDTQRKTHEAGEDITAFVHSIDQGLAPAAHYGFFWDGSQSGGTGEIDYLLAQAEAENCDAVVLGVYDDSSVLTPMRWYYDAANDQFVGEDAAVTRSTSGFDTTSSGEWFVFLGLPFGMGERFAVDYDLDGYYNLDDVGDEYDPTQPGGANPGDPSIVGSIEVVWETARVARVRFQTDEATTAKITYGPAADWPDGALTAEDATFSKAHSMLLTGLEPSTDNGNWTGGDPPDVTQNYSFEVEITDLDGDDDTIAGDDFRTLSFIHPQSFDPASRVRHRQRLLEHYVSELEVSEPIVDDQIDDKITFDVDVTVRFKRGIEFDATNDVFVAPPAAERAIVSRVFLIKNDGTYAEALAKSTSTTVLADEVALLGSFGGSRKLLVTDSGLSIRGRHVIANTLTDGSGKVSFEVEVALPITEPRALAFVIDGVVEVFDTDDQTAGNQGWEDALNDLAGCSTAPCALVLPGDTPNYPPSSGSDVSQGWSQWSFPDSKEARTFVILPID